MSCRCWRKRMSDRLDGALSPRQERRLEAHLAVCAVCRSYARSLEVIQAEAARVHASTFTRNDGEQFLIRLKRRLREDGAQAGESALPVWKRKWAWVSGGLAVAAGVLAWALVLRPIPRADIYLLSEKDFFSRIYQQYGRSPDMESVLDEVLVSSIDESLKAADDLPSNPFDNPLLSEGVSDEDLKLLAEDIAADKPE